MGHCSSKIESGKVAFLVVLAIVTGSLTYLATMDMGDKKSRMYMSLLAGMMATLAGLILLGVTFGLDLGGFALLVLILAGVFYLRNHMKKNNCLHMIDKMDLMGNVPENDVDLYKTAIGALDQLKRAKLQT